MGTAAAAMLLALTALLTACSDGDTTRTSVPGAGPVTLPSPGESAPTASAPSPSSAAPAAGDDGTDRFATRAGISDRRVVDAAAELDVDDQSGDGRVVRVREVSVSRGPGHLAIFTDAGRLLGSARVTPAVSPASVRLDLPVPATGELVAVMFSDDGNGAFDVATDVPLNEGGLDTDPGEVEDEDFVYRLR